MQYRAKLASKYRTSANLEPENKKVTQFCKVQSTLIRPIERGNSRLETTSSFELNA